MIIEFDRVMNLLIRKKFPEKVLNEADYVWLDVNEHSGEYYCMLCAGVVGDDFNIYRAGEQHALAHIKELNLTAFI